MSTRSPLGCDSSEYVKHPVALVIANIDGIPIAESADVDCTGRVGLIAPKDDFV